MATISSLTAASSIDPIADYLPIVTANINTTQKINRNTLLGITSSPVGISDTQTLTSKTLTSPTISGPTLSGTVTGTYTLGGTPTFPSTVVLTTGTQTLSGKTLTSPTINSPTITNASISADTLTGYTTSNSGTIYGLSVTTGKISGTSITSSTITGSQIAPSTIATSNIASGVLAYNNFSNPYKFRAWGNTTQSVDSTVSTVMIFNNIDYDTGSNFNTSTYTFTAPVAGWYHFDYRIGHWANASYSTEVLLFVNGSFTSRGNLATNTSSNQGSDTLKLNANDQVKVIGYSSTTQNNGAGSGSDSSVQYFSGFLMSAT